MNVQANSQIQTLSQFHNPLGDAPYPVLEALITSVKGSAPTQAGDSMLLLSNGRWLGSVGGGNLEWKLMQAGQLSWWRWQETGQLPSASTMTINHGLGCHSDQCCGGRVEARLVMVPAALKALMNEQAARIYQIDAEERLQLVGGYTAGKQPLGDTTLWANDSSSADSKFTNSRLRLVVDNNCLLRQPKDAPQLWIFGAGHIARALAPLASALDFRVSVFDGRPQWADPEAFPDEVNVRPVAMPESIDQADANTTVLIMTHSHKLDYELLQQMNDWSLGYLGVIGSKTKAVRFRHRLDNEGIDDSHIHMPIGLPDMGKSPMAVAVSCMAELLQLRERGELSTAEYGDSV